ncbi:hypothetical protein [Thermaerobacillus caldiproteolyticus]|uniref:hypothetical protein n=1 Tax=Thermaerobacillus caldiproteolyticus TaxID=247480 RepID=UPI0018F15AB8|nr:hypothetical protein [Anoxybacillus caldiproteolyticus]
MNENQLIRSYMASHLKVKTFAAHVACCIRQQLLQFDRSAVVHLDHGTNFFLFYGQALGRSFQVILTLAEVEELKAEGPYALDRYIWYELEAKGISILHMTPYLQAVFFN